MPFYLLLVQFFLYFYGTKSNPLLTYASLYCRYQGPSLGTSNSCFTYLTHYTFTSDP